MVAQASQRSWHHLGNGSSFAVLSSISLGLLLQAQVAGASHAMRGFLSAGFPATEKGANFTEIDHPLCSSSVSKLVRQRLDEEVRTFGREEYHWPEGCPFDPSADLFADMKPGAANRTSVSKGFGQACLADYCEVFGVCRDSGAQHEQPQECDATAMSRIRKRCDQAIARCFPPGSSSQLARTLHTRYSRQWCQVLDCQVQAHRRHEHANAMMSLSSVLAFVVLLCAALFLGMVLLVGGDEVVLLCQDVGAVSSTSARECLRMRTQLRALLGLSRTKGN
eukprot:gb/GFBE01059702.1/.p1 GENE.gb/GFBE01059702.1/~~gb/GFBE01059702.1/.p1  ORF type:complete len:279 (+),score=42.92 gb/GFBE01059702.1/:1-837(+)